MSSNKPHKGMFEKGRKLENEIDTDGTAGLLMKRGTAADEITAMTAATEECVGVCEDQGDAGDYMLLQKFGIVSLYADGAISQDEELVPSGNTNGYAAAVGGATTGDSVVGKALEAAADGDSFKAVLYIDQTETAP